MIKHTSFTRFIVAASFAGASLLGAAAVQAQEAGTRVGFVNIERIFSEATASKAAQVKLKQEFSSREQLLSQQGNALKKAIDQFNQQAPKMTEADRVAKEKQLMVQDAEFQKKRREFQEDLSNRKSEEMQRFVQKANLAVEQVAKREKFQKIDQDAVWIDPQIDITDKVLQVLNSGK